MISGRQSRIPRCLCRCLRPSTRERRILSAARHRSWSRSRAERRSSATPGKYGTPPSSARDRASASQKEERACNGCRCACENPLRASRWRRSGQADPAPPAAAARRSCARTGWCRRSSRTSISSSRRALADHRAACSPPRSSPFSTPSATGRARRGSRARSASIPPRARIANEPPGHANSPPISSGALRPVCVRLSHESIRHSCCRAPRTPPTSISEFPEPGA